MTAEEPEKEEARQEGVQILMIGVGRDLGGDVLGLLGKRCVHTLSVPGDQWQETSWQSARFPGSAWVLVGPEVEKASGIEGMLECVQLCSLVFRPQRLLAITELFNLDQVLRLLRMGADGILPTGADAFHVVNELSGPGLRREEYFPQPERWLQTLTRGAQTLDFSRPLEYVFRKQLRLFVSQLGVDRASAWLLEGEEMRLIASVGLPDSMGPGTRVAVAAGSVSAWVIEHRRARLVHGQYVPDGDIAGERNDAEHSICAPLLDQERVLGVLSFSTLEDGRELNHADMATAEVFAAMLSMAVANNRLVKEGLEAERLATIGATMASLSHCLKNLLMLLKGSVSMMEMAVEKKDISTVDSTMPILRTGVDRVERLVVDLLDYAKHRPPQLVPVKLSNFLKEIEAAVSQIPRERGQELALEDSTDGATYQLDPVRLERAILNLLTNGSQAAPRGGHLLVSVEEAREGSMLRISASDDGPGVSDEDKPHLFEPFFSTKGSQGTGLGLPMVKHFCEESGGWVEADRCPRLGGLRLSMYLPADPAGPAPPATERLLIPGRFPRCLLPPGHTPGKGDHPEPRSLPSRNERQAAILYLHAHLLRERRAAPRPCLRGHRHRRAGALPAAHRP